MMFRSMKARLRIGGGGGGGEGEREKCLCESNHVKTSLISFSNF